MKQHAWSRIRWGVVVDCLNLGREARFAQPYSVLVLLVQGRFPPSPKGASVGFAAVLGLFLVTIMAPRRPKCTSRGRCAPGHSRTPRGGQTTEQ